MLTSSESLERKLKVNGMHAFGVIKEMFFRRAEQANRQQGAAPGSRNPACHLERIFRHQRRG